MWGDSEIINKKLIKRLLEWLVYLTRMADHRAPKRTLLGWLPQKRSPGGTQSVVNADLVISDTWYTLALHKNQWDSLYAERVCSSHSSQQLSRETLPTVQITVCGRLSVGCRIEQDISALRNESQCTNTRVHYSVLPVGSGSGVKVVLPLCTILVK